VAPLLGDAHLEGVDGPPGLNHPVPPTGIERDAQELKRANELGTYLRAALKREEILLRRRPDIERAQAVRAGP
jgi:hypothetical protein